MPAPTAGPSTSTRSPRSAPPPARPLTAAPSPIHPTKYRLSHSHQQHHPRGLGHVHRTLPAFSSSRAAGRLTSKKQQAQGVVWSSDGAEGDGQQEGTPSLVSASEGEDEDEDSDMSDDGWEDVQGRADYAGGFGGGQYGEPNPLAPLASSALRSLKQSPLAHQPGSDYSLFEHTYCTGLQRSKALFSFLSEDVVAALIPQLELLENRARKSMDVIEKEKANLVGAEAAARQEETHSLLTSLTSLVSSHAANRSSVKTDLSELAQTTTTRLALLSDKYAAASAQLVQKQVAAAAGTAAKKGGGKKAAGGGGGRRGRR
ncbi:hypothetical protein JCM8547_004471 [Rhodosporidiobolus lusitaniae]